MAPHLLGEHLLATCSECHFQFACDPRAKTSQLKLVCPNCGFDRISPNSTSRHPAVEFELTTQNEPWKRFEIIAFRFRDRSEFGVKRIVGLPGEAIHFAEGDLFVNEQRIAKQPQEITEQMILVYDSKYSRPTTTTTPPRLTNGDINSTWSSNGKHWEFTHSENHNHLNDDTALLKPERNRLSYRHIACYRQPPQALANIAVTDALAYNQTLTQQLQPIDQLIAVWELQFGRQAQMELVMENCSSKCRIQIDTVSAIVRCQVNDAQLNSFQFDPNIEAAELIMAFVDGYWTVWMDRTVLCQIASTKLEVIDSDLKPDNCVDPAIPPVVYVEGQNGDIEVRRFRLYRDIYYRYPDGVDSSKRWQLGADEYFVVGDNQAISIDSRNWDRAGMSQQQIIAKLRAANINEIDSTIR